MLWRLCTVGIVIDRETAYYRFARRHPLVALLFGAVVFLPFMVGVVVGGCLLVLRFMLPRRAS